MTVVISDLKLTDTTFPGSSTDPRPFRVDVRSYSHYYPFGMLQPGRHGNSDEYRYGYNGKESDNEWKGTGNVYDYGFRVYDPRVGRFLSEDPLTAKYADFSCYLYANNMPIAKVDIDGLFGLYFDEDGDLLGDDNDDDGLQYVTTPDAVEANTEDGVTNWDAICQPSQSVRLPCANNRREIGEFGMARFHANGESSIHEEGFLIMRRLTGDDGLLWVNRGDDAQYGRSEIAINLALENLENPYAIETEDILYDGHFHPDGQVYPTTDPASKTRGGRGPEQFGQEPSSVDREHAANVANDDPQHPRIHIVISPKNDKVYFYDKNGITFEYPFRNFIDPDLRNE